METAMVVDRKEDIRGLTLAAAKRYRVFRTQELMQELMELVDEAVMRYYDPERGTLSTFIYTVVGSHGHRLARRLFARYETEVVDSNSHHFEELSDPSAEGEFQAVEDRDAILRAVDRLDPKWVPAVRAMVEHPEAPVTAAAKVMRCSRQHIRDQVVYPLRKYLSEAVSA